MVRRLSGSTLGEVRGDVQYDLVNAEDAVVVGHLQWNAIDTLVVLQRFIGQTSQVDID